MIISPCISICKTDPKTGYCYGCGRSTEEKIIWKGEKTSDEWKKNNPIRSKAVQPRPIRPLIMFVSALHKSKKKAPNIKPKT